MKPQLCYLLLAVFKSNISYNNFLLVYIMKLHNCILFDTADPIIEKRGKQKERKNHRLSGGGCSIFVYDHCESPHTQVLYTVCL